MHRRGTRSRAHGAAVQPHPRRGRSAVRPRQHRARRTHRRDRHARRAAPPQAHVAERRAGGHTPGPVGPAGRPRPAGGRYARAVRGGHRLVGHRAAPADRRGTDHPHNRATHSGGVVPAALPRQRGHRRECLQRYGRPRPARVAPRPRRAAAVGARPGQPARLLRERDDVAVPDRRRARVLRPGPSGHPRRAGADRTGVRLQHRRAVRLALGLRAGDRRPGQRPDRGAAHPRRGGGRPSRAAGRHCRRAAGTADRCSARHPRGRRGGRRDRGS